MAIFTAAWAADRRGKPGAAAALIGVLCVIKPFYGVFGVYWVFQRSLGRVAVAVATFALGQLISVALVGTNEYLAWLHKLQTVGWQSYLYNASIWGVGSRLFAQQSMFRGAVWTPLTSSRPLEWTVDLILLALVIFVALRVLTQRHNVDEIYGVLGITGLILSPLGWITYAPVALGPVLSATGEEESSGRWVLGMLAVIPYGLIANHRPDRLGTLILAFWALSLPLGVLLWLQRTNRKFA
jgi:hypothetical protein